MVLIGVDPHKATHTAVAVDRSEEPIARVTVAADRRQVQRLLAWAEPLGGERRWAVESANGLGRLLSQQLVAAGEVVVDVPATLAARVRLLGSTKAAKNDPNDALSTAIAGLRHDDLRRVTLEDHATVLRLLSDRHHNLTVLRIRTVCRLHVLLRELIAGGGPPTDPGRSSGPAPEVGSPGHGRDRRAQAHGPRAGGRHPAARP